MINFNSDEIKKDYIYNPQKKTSISFAQIFANSLYISDNDLNSITFNESRRLALLILKEPEVIVSTLIACWQSNIHPAILSPNLNKEEYLSYSNEFKTNLFIVEDDIFDSESDIVQIKIKFDNSIELNSFNLNFNEENIALILFSSGTTGKPKSIPLSFNNITSNINSFTKNLRITNANEFLCASPLWHAHGLYNSFLTALFLKTRVFYLGQISLLNVNILFEAIKLNKNIIFHITPSMIPILLMISNKIAQLPIFYRVVCGTSFLDLKSKVKFEDVYKTQIIQQYGMTETLFMTVNSFDSINRPDSVGRALDSVKIEIWNNNNQLQVGEVGSIRVKSTSYFGYSYDEYFNVDAIKNEYFNTQDLGYLDDDGYLYITGREKDLIKKGGFSISANQLDSKILLLNEINESCTISVLDEIVGEEIYTFYVASQDFEKKYFVNHLNSFFHQNLQPKTYYRISEIPKNSIGKYDKLKLIEILKSKFNV